MELIARLLKALISLHEEQPSGQSRPSVAWFDISLKRSYFWFACSYINNRDAERTLGI
ncbi:hypothetical protein BN77_p2150008 [Rhizobium mesoamericanum STM3625]|uniref:Uncharacterized protein n=1 Tax=Rhizobium mesoamericanum STM3625 TaxID=1211777 RepID=K0Q4D3_9HYPH|nr:hypothetical protein BN77_p2150008 [Rhizobium mesoamericanum STM3625]